ncbi:long-chain-fatty-acid-CoA ligase [Novymonas esmeraldas]|uniref:Long-chain-fatty-acid-CoA ligase n=1 Tax=Novymonas esmeraldas TaxID=1808958 RepID=A0AAW0EPP3_9TRYP
MGGCVATLLDARNSVSVTPSHEAAQLRAYGPLSVAVPATATSTSTAVYRNGRVHDDAAHEALCKSVYHGASCTHRFKDACSRYAAEPRIAYRPVLKRVMEEVSVGNGETRKMEVTHLGPTQHMRLGDVWARVLGFSRGLAELGLEKRVNVALYEETRWEWLASIYGVWLQDMVASTVYANLGEDALFYALRETECRAIVCNGKSVPALLRGVASGAFPACALIYLDALPATGCEALHGCRVISWTEVVALGHGAGAHRSADPPTDNDAVALIMYTSGTTGDPKGVVHTHGSIISGILTMDDWLYSMLDHSPDDLYLSYLPLAHILEFGVVNVFLSRGAIIGFGSPRTLTDVTARPHGDFTEYHPRCIIAVPRVFDTIKRAVEAKLPSVGTLQRRVFDHAYQSRLASLKEGKDTPYWNAKVFSKARAALGGNASLLSGGGPLSASTQEFINVVFGYIVNGWGLTETVCVGAIQRLGDLTPCAVGQVLGSEELKLVDVEEYKHTDTPHPRGELCLRGPFLFKGYYRHPELTREAIDEDGWFHTGDVGSIDAEGRVSIVGRIKALAKNCLGEYIALEALEAIYGNHPLVLNNCICVLVNPDRRYVAVLAVTSVAKVRKFAREHPSGLPASAVDESMPAEAVMRLPEFCAAASASMAALGTSARRQPFELPRAAAFVLEEWTPESGALTAAMKLRRGVLQTTYADLIEDVFKAE